MSDECSGMNSNEALAHAQLIELEAQRDRVRNTNLIIALQSKLLSQTDQINMMNKENADEKRKNKALAKEVFTRLLLFADFCTNCLSESALDICLIF